MDRRQQKRLLYELSEMSDSKAFFLSLDIFIRKDLNPLYSDLFAVRPTSDQFDEIDDKRYITLAHIEDFRVFMFMQGVMGMMALVSAFADNNKMPLISWLIASFIFSLSMFMVYKSLVLALRGVKYLSRVKQPMS